MNLLMHLVLCQGEILIYVVVRKWQSLPYFLAKPRYRLLQWLCVSSHFSEYYNFSKWLVRSASLLSYHSLSSYSTCYMRNIMSHTTCNHIRTRTVDFLPTWQHHNFVRVAFIQCTPRRKLGRRKPPDRRRGPRHWIIKKEYTRSTFNGEISLGVSKEARFNMRVVPLLLPFAPCKAGLVHFRKFIKEMDSIFYSNTGIVNQ